jgi:pyridoxal phosphate enzyme (YggS family)
MDGRMSGWLARWEQVEERVEAACARAGRLRSEVRVIAVSKTRTAEEIQEAYDAGQRDFGESRLQELQQKSALLPRDIVWHFIGPLQSNKAKRIAGLSDIIHSLDNPRQLAEIAKQTRQIGAFLQVNLAREPQKSGIFAEDLDALIAQAAQCSSVGALGLMTIGPQVEDPEESRSWFQSLLQLAREKGFSRVSMGMSHDFEAAIEEGATDVRVGSALFGRRSGR